MFFVPPSGCAKLCATNLKPDVVEYFSGNDLVFFDLIRQFFRTVEGPLIAHFLHEKHFDLLPIEGLLKVQQMDFDPETKKIRLKSVHPGFTVDDIKENVMFDLIIPDDVPTTVEPTQEQIDIMHKLDPNGIYLGKGG